LGENSSEAEVLLFAIGERENGTHRTMLVELVGVPNSSGSEFPSQIIVGL